ncbi:hypothetical protein VCUG_00496 [Vavraia culicis subsp. floridensis]|uniref:Uncharacterized protein n=1 Tax=Vavraia culicis (isolate floridensis) TaxID=948595 RepID=L2GXP6_VAVCU|nr:uncharacterized protein VCUG_00496 [Vavraia culicis subsp. floridensis]ELA48073.1 hypothetical protein VCUG_00496 [Vavraia culicis subsp. floridensis]
MREEIGQRGVGQKKKQKMMENGRVIEKKKCEESVVSDINMRRSEHVVENEELRRIKGKEKVSSGRENEEVKRQKTNKNGQLTTKTTRKGIKSVKGDANGDVSNIGSAATSAEEDGSLDLVCKIYEQLWKRYQYGNEKVYVKGFTAEQIMYQMKDLIDHVVKEAEKKMDECEGDGVYDEHSSNACSSSDPCDKRCANDSDAHESSSEEDESTDENDGTAVHKIDSYQTSLDVLKALDAATKSEYELDEEIESEYGEDL